MLTCFENSLSIQSNNPNLLKPIQKNSEHCLGEKDFIPFFKNQSSRLNNSVSCPNEKRLIGYMIAKSEGHVDKWHGHVTALTVAPEYRRLGLATKLMLELEETSERKRCYFVDLFVRASNKLGHEIYTKLGYIIYRRVLNYYWGTEEDEDAYDMRKALSTDVEKKSIIPMTRPVRPEELEHP